MRHQPAPLTCKKCGNAFTGMLPVECKMDEFARAIEKLECPKCGAGYKALSITFGDAADTLTQPEAR